MNRHRTSKTVAISYQSERSASQSDFLFVIFCLALAAAVLLSSASAARGEQTAHGKTQVSKHKHAKARRSKAHPHAKQGPPKSHHAKRPPSNLQLPKNAKGLLINGLFRPKPASGKTVPKHGSMAKGLSESEAYGRKSMRTGLPPESSRACTSCGTPAPVLPPTIVARTRTLPIPSSKPNSIALRLSDQPTPEAYGTTYGQSASIPKAAQPTRREAETVMRRLPTPADERELSADTDVANLGPVPEVGHSQISVLKRNNRSPASLLAAGEPESIESVDELTAPLSPLGDEPGLLGEGDFRSIADTTEPDRALGPRPSRSGSTTASVRALKKFVSFSPTTPAASFVVQPRPDRNDPSQEQDSSGRPGTPEAPASLEKLPKSVEDHHQLESIDDDRLSKTPDEHRLAEPPAVSVPDEPAWLEDRVKPLQQIRLQIETDDPSEPENYGANTKPFTQEDGLLVQAGLGSWHPGRHASRPGDQFLDCGQVHLERNGLSLAAAAHFFGSVAAPSLQPMDPSRGAGIDSLRQIRTKDPTPRMLQ